MCIPRDPSPRLTSVSNIPNLTTYSIPIVFSVSVVFLRLHSSIDHVISLLPPILKPQPLHTPLLNLAPTRRDDALGLVVPTRLSVIRHCISSIGVTSQTPVVVWVIGTTSTDRIAELDAGYRGVESVGV